MIGIYFSGTGNSKHCIERFMKEYDGSSNVLSIEDPLAIKAIQDNEFIIFAYPIQFSNIPKIVRDYIVENKDCFEGKQIFIIATMGLFSGDGAGCSARLFRKYGAKIVGGLHLKMPDCIGDEKLLKRSLEDNKRLIQAAEIKIHNAVKNLKRGNPPQEGLNIVYHLAGLLGQRLWFYSKTKTYSDKLKVDTSKCVGCGLCSRICPKDNLVLENRSIRAKGECTMCYRCVSHCPKQAITLLGTKVYEQCKLENYI